MPAGRRKFLENWPKCMWFELSMKHKSVLNTFHDFMASLFSIGVVTDRRAQFSHIFKISQQTNGFEFWLSELGKCLEGLVKYIQAQRINKKGPHVERGVFAPSCVSRSDECYSFSIEI